MTSSRTSDLYEALVRVTPRLGTLAANKCSCGDQQQHKWEHVIRLNQCFPIACTMRYHEPDKNVNRLAVGTSEDLGR